MVGANCPGQVVKLLNLQICQFPGYRSSPRAERLVSFVSSEGLLRIAQTLDPGLNPAKLTLHCTRPNPAPLSRTTPSAMQPKLSPLLAGLDPYGRRPSPWWLSWHHRPFQGSLPAHLERKPSVAAGQKISVLSPMNPSGSRKAEVTGHPHNANAYSCDVYSPDVSNVD